VDLHLHRVHFLVCFLSTSVYSALGVSGFSAIMRYINRRFTYLLTVESEAREKDKLGLVATVSYGKKLRI